MSARINIKSKKFALMMVFFAVIFILAGIFYIKECNKLTKHTKTVYALDTQITLTTYEHKADDSTLNKAEAEIYRLEDLLSVTKADSDIYTINHSDVNSTKVNSDTSEIISFALDMAKKTDGALDISLYPIIRTWGFTTGNYKIVSDEELSELLPLVDYKKIDVDKDTNTVFLPSGMQIDLGAVGKGYIGDKIIALLKQNNVKSAIVNLGGNVQTLGKKPDNTLWKVGIKAPDSNDYLGIVEVFDCAVITSGAYERFFIGDDGKKYGHILDSKTGKPVNNEMLSVTIIGSEGKVCDALSTALFVMGKARAIEYWKQNRNFDMILLTKDHNLYLSKNIADKFVLQDKFKYLTVTVVQ